MAEVAYPRSGFSMEDVKNGARVAVGAVVAGFSFAEMWKDDVEVEGSDTAPSPEIGSFHAGAPTSIVLTLLATASIAMVIFGLIMLFERSPVSKSYDAPEWKLEAAKAQMYVSLLAFLSSSFYVGFESTGEQSIGDVLAEVPGGLFLGLALLKIVEAVTSFVSGVNPEDALYRSVGQNISKQSWDERLFEKEQATKHAWVSLGFSLALALSALFLVDERSFSTSTEFIFFALIGLIVALGFVLLAQGWLYGLLLDGTGDDVKFRWHYSSDLIIGLLASAVLSAVAMQVGRGFFRQTYEESAFVASNFYYYAALLFGFYGVVSLESDEHMEERTRLTNSQISSGVLVLMAVFLGIISTVALWGTDVLYNELEKGVNEKLQLSVYAVVTVLVLASHVVLTRVVEAVIMPELNVCKVFSFGLGNLFQDGGMSDTTAISTKRSEATLALALASAVYFGHATSELSLALLFVGAAAARTVGFWHRFREGADGKTDPGSQLGAFLYDDSTRPLEFGQPGVIFGGISIIASHIFTSVYVFRDGEPVPEGSSTLRYWELTAWILLTTHVVLTLTGLISKVHAGFLPLVRFGASSFIIVILSASLGEHSLKDHLYPYIVPALVTYIMYDSLSQARF